VGQADDLADELADELAAGPSQRVNLLPGFVSPADIRHLKEMIAGFGLAATVLPDISETLDGPALLDYPLIPAGGTPLAAIRAMGGAGATIELSSTLDEATSAGALLRAKTSVPLHRLDLPIGIMATDRLLARLATISGRGIPEKYRAERGRLVDGLVDGHKYVSGKRAVVYGEEDLVVGLTAFLAEIGVRPVLCASGGRSGRLAAAIRAATGDILVEQPRVYEGADFFEIAEQAEQLAPDLLVGHSKGYTLARKLNIPLIRVGFPIHDRIGGQRLPHLGFQGAMALFDRIAYGLIEKKQADSGVGYSYM
jgi:nitrogenase molybdenum-iron protein NifN